MIKDRTQYSVVIEFQTKVRAVSLPFEKATRNRYNLLPKNSWQSKDSVNSDTFWIVRIIIYLQINIALNIFWK